MAQQDSRQPVSDHYLTQAGLAVALEQAVARLWPQVDYRNLAGTLPGFRDDVRLLVRQFARSSAALAARDYSRARRAAGIRSTFTVKPAGLPNVERVDKALGWATRNLYDQSLLAPDASPATIKEVVDNALTQVEGVTARLVLNTGRETTVAAVTEDRQARAWAREARPDCCAFCAMLSSRGAVYKNEHAAGRYANQRFTGDGQFKFHDNCHCQAVPVFGEYEPTAHARQWAADWASLRDANGGSLSLNEWRRHIEGRPTQDDPQLAG